MRRIAFSAAVFAAASSAGDSSDGPPEVRDSEVANGRFSSGLPSSLLLSSESSSSSSLPEEEAEFETDLNPPTFFEEHRQISRSDRDRNDRDETDQWIAERSRAQPPSHRTVEDRETKKKHHNEDDPGRLCDVVDGVCFVKQVDHPFRLSWNGSVAVVNRTLDCLKDHDVFPFPFPTHERRPIAEINATGWLNVTNSTMRCREIVLRAKGNVTIDGLSVIDATATSEKSVGGEEDSKGGSYAGLRGTLQPYTLITANINRFNVFDCKPDPFLTELAPEGSRIVLYAPENPHIEPVRPRNSFSGPRNCNLTVYTDFPAIPF